jgi:hypothetical protein
MTCCNRASGSMMAVMPGSAEPSTARAAPSVPGAGKAVDGAGRMSGIAATSDNTDIAQKAPRFDSAACRGEQGGGGGVLTVRELVAGYL